MRASVNKNLLHPGGEPAPWSREVASYLAVSAPAQGNVLHYGLRHDITRVRSARLPYTSLS